MNITRFTSPDDLNYRDSVRQLCARRSAYGQHYDLDALGADLWHLTDRDARWVSASEMAANLQVPFGLALDGYRFGSENAYPRLPRREELTDGSFLPWEVEPGALPEGFTFADWVALVASVRDMAAAQTGVAAAGVRALDLAVDLVNGLDVAVAPGSAGSFARLAAGRLGLGVFARLADRYRVGSHYRWDGGVDGLGDDGAGDVPDVPLDLSGGAFSFR